MINTKMSDADTIALQQKQIRALEVTVERLQRQLNALAGETHKAMKIAKGASNDVSALSQRVRSARQ